MLVFNRCNKMDGIKKKTRKDINSPYCQLSETLYTLAQQLFSVDAELPETDTGDRHILKTWPLIGL